MGVVNARTGVTSQQQIYDNSLYLTRFLKPSQYGRKSILAHEFMDPSKDNLIGYTQVDKSMFLLIPTYYPEIYTNVKDGEVLKKSFIGTWNLIAQSTRAVSGFQDIAINIQNPQFKTPFFTMPLFTVLENPTNEITLTVATEYSGYLITNQMRHWLNAISDEYTKIATYNGYDEDFNNWSHSAGMIYIKPNKTFNKCDYAALMYLMVPKSVKTSNFDADATSPEVITMDITFNVLIIDNRNVRVNELAHAVLTKYKEIICEDSTLFGMVKGTSLDSVREIASRDIIGQMVNV